MFLVELVSDIQLLKASNEIKVLLDLNPPLLFEESFCFLYSPQSLSTLHLTVKIVSPQLLPRLSLLLQSLLAELALVHV